jgi:hypothetical protein
MLSVTYKPFMLSVITAECRCTECRYSKYHRAFLFHLDVRGGNPTKGSLSTFRDGAVSPTQGLLDGFRVRGRDHTQVEVKSVTRSGLTKVLKPMTISTIG